LLTKAAKGKHTGLPEVLMRKIQRVEVNTDEPLPVYVDGEPGSDATRHVTFEIAARELPVLMPAK
jgi:diacylglycerol kinase family enzyme